MLPPVLARTCSCPCRLGAPPSHRRLPHPPAPRRAAPYSHLAGPAPLFLFRRLRPPLPPRPRFRSSDSSVPAPDHDAGEDEARPAAMSRRLEQATEDALLASPGSARRTVEEGGFSPEIKARLLARIAAAAGPDPTERGRTAAAAAGLGVPAAAPAGARADAAARPWTGTETTADAVRRMLEDSHKPLPADLRPRRPRPSPSTGQRVGDARDMAARYVDERGLSEKERAAMRRELRERFEPAARAVPASMSGLAAIANQRIEDAIARGQFKNISRGKAVERDPRADNPFIDTTEYMMNRLIQRQALAPPWIEKQQELTAAVSAFRARLRADWKRHAVGMLVGAGGTLADQVRRAGAHARAEAEVGAARALGSSDRAAAAVPAVPAYPAVPADDGLTLAPLRDPAWETRERAFLSLAVDKLNGLARSYNLMAPELARKGYFSVDRELRTCYADVAPLLPGGVAEAAAAGQSGRGGSEGGWGAVFGAGGGPGGARGWDAVRPTEEPEKKRYGLREMWRDLWSGS